MLENTDCRHQREYKIDDCITDHQQAGDGSRPKGRYAQDSGEGRLHFESRPPPERLTGDNEARHNTHLDRRIISYYSADLLHPAADERQPIQPEEDRNRNQIRGQRAKR